MNKKELDLILTKDNLSKLLSSIFSIKSICESLNINYSHYNKFIKSKINHYGLEIDKRKQRHNWRLWEDEYLKKILL